MTRVGLGASVGLPVGISERVEDVGEPREDGAEHVQSGDGVSSPLLLDRFAQAGRDHREDHHPIEASGLPHDVSSLCDVLHHVADRPAWLAKLAAAMKSGARVVLVEFKEGKLPHGPPEAAKIPRARLVELLTQAGLALDYERQDLLPYQVFLIFTKP